MKIHGFQKMTLLDYPSKIACTLFTAGCNFRCPFCHNASLVTKIDLSGSIDKNEIMSYLKKRKGVLDGVCVTGGEPLLYNDTKDLLKELKDMGYCVKLDTNGTFPKTLYEALNEGVVDYVAMDIKNSKEKYALTTGIKNLDISPVEESVSLLLNGTVDYEFRTTVVKEFHTLEDMENIGRWICGAKRYFLQSFTDSGDLVGENMHGVAKEEMEKMRDTVRKYVPDTEIRGI